MSNIPSIEELSLKCQKAFANAEKILKRCEYVPKQDKSKSRKSDDNSCSIEFQGVFIPVINELRYAGKHLSDFNVTKKYDDLYEAYFHCLRAKYDAYDSLIQYRSRDILQFIEQYKLLVVSEIITGYADYKRQFKDILERNGRGSEEDSKEKKVTNVEVETLEESVNTREKDYEALGAICEIFDSNRDDLDARLKKARDERFWKLAGLIVAVLGSAIALVIKFA